jgi:hypothetical protein
MDHGWNVLLPRGRGGWGGVGVIGRRLGGRRIRVGLGVGLGFELDVDLDLGLDHGLDLGRASTPKRITRAIYYDVLPYRGGGVICGSVVVVLSSLDGDFGDHIILPHRRWRWREVFPILFRHVD